MHAALLLLLAYLAGAASAARAPDASAASLRAAGAVGAAPICEAYAPGQCPNRCYICTRLDGLKLCVPKNVAEKLSPAVFTCAHAPAVGVASAGQQALRSGGVEVPCQDFDAHECQSHTNECALCTSLLSPEGRCYRPDDARALPQIVFKCRWPEL